MVYKLIIGENIKRTFFHDMLKTYKILVLVFINKILLEKSLFIYLGIIYGCFHNTRAELNSYNREDLTHKS